SVAFDLLCLVNSIGVPPELIKRLKHPDQFEGARYELWAAASAIRAGFHVEFEDETDRRKSHCEFTATHPRTKRQFSVEAKRRHRKGYNALTVGRERYVKPDVQGLISDALKKQADHQRIIFVDLNLPPFEKPIPEEPWVPSFKASKELLEKQPAYRGGD